MKSGSLLHLAWCSLRQHRMANLITVLTTALAVGLAFSVFSINAQARAAFVGGAGGYDAVLGARGSPLQLVLNTVFHLETSPGNIPWTLYRTTSERAGVRRAVPFAVGDSYEGFRVVGTTLSYFTDPPKEATPFQVQSGGRWFDEKHREAVVGSRVAQRTGLSVGQTIHPSHGLASGSAHQHEYVVVGILEPSNTPTDRVVWIPIEGVMRMDGHVLRGHGDDFSAVAGESIPEEHLEVSAVLLDLSNPQVGFTLAQHINRQDQVATLAYPISRVVAEVFDKLGWAHRLLGLISYLVMLVATGAIVAGLIQLLESRRTEFATLRALGMPRQRLFSLLILESALLAAAGSLAGFIVYAGILGVASSVVREQTGVALQVFSFHPVFVWGPLLMIGLGALAGVLPARRAYATPVAENLT